MMEPSFSKAVQYTSTPHEKDGCEEPGCYDDTVSYSYSDQQIEAIISQSTECSQSIVLNCTANPITDFRYVKQYS